MSVASPEHDVEVNGSGRRWLLRAAFEAALILFGLLAALALNAWRDSEAREARVDALAAAIRAELEGNLERHARASAFNSEIADFLWNEGSKGVAFIPASALPNGLFRGPSLTSAAWTTAQGDAALSDMSVERVLMLARVYEAQRIYVEDFRTLTNNMYAQVLESNDTVARVDGIAQPLALGGVLRDYAGHGEDLVELYKATLLELGVQPARLLELVPPPSDEAGSTAPAPANETP